MKALPNRKGNTHSSIAAPTVPVRLNESPSKEEGKSSPRRVVRLSQRIASMKALPNRKGNADPEDLSNPTAEASMKVPPKRKGNVGVGVGVLGVLSMTLNESPSEKEGK